MRIEESELFDKKYRLYDFINSEGFEKLDAQLQAMLKVQLGIMEQYNSILCCSAIKMEIGIGGHTGFSFGTAMKYLKAGMYVKRSGWDDKQVAILKRTDTSIDLSSCVLFNDSCCDTWKPTLNDVFAEDWELVL